MCPTFGAEPRFGTHPMAWAAPGGKNEADFLFDVATTQVILSSRHIFTNFTKHESTNFFHKILFVSFLRFFFYEVKVFN